MSDKPTSPAFSTPAPPPFDPTWTISDYQTEVVVLRNKLSKTSSQLTRTRALMQQISSHSEHELESIVNTLLLKFNKLKANSVKAAAEMEVEEEQIINRLLRRISEVGREKKELEERVQREIEQSPSTTPRADAPSPPTLGSNI